MSSKLAFQMAISPQWVIRSTSRLILRWGFLARQIEWTYFRLDQIQDGGGPPSWRISNSHISRTGRPINFVFDPRVGFSRMADRLDLLLVGPNPRWRLSKMAAGRHLRKFQMATSPERVVRSTSCLTLG